METLSSGADLVGRQFRSGNQNVQAGSAFERRAMGDTKNRQRSLGVYLPLPSAILRVIDVDARSN
jgi:hypothetical protein